MIKETKDIGFWMGSEEMLHVIQKAEALAGGIDEEADYYLGDNEYNEFVLGDEEHFPLVMQDTIDLHAAEDWNGLVNHWAERIKEFKAI